MKKKILIVVLLYCFKTEAQTYNYKIADSLFKIGRYQKALKELDKSKPNYETHYKKGVIYSSIDNYRKAIFEFEKALLFTDDYQLKIELANLYQKNKQQKNAISIYNEILAKDSLNLVLQYKLGKLYLSLKDIDNSKKAFKKLVRKEPSNANYWYCLGNSYALEGDRDRKINSFLTTFRNDSLHINAIVKLAASYNSLRDRDSTQIFVKKGLAIDNNQVALLKLKVNQFYREKKFKQTLPYLNKLQKINTEDTYTVSMLGRVHYNLENYNEAKKYFRKLFQIDRENYKAHTYLGHIAMREEQFSVAKLHYQLAAVIGKEKRDEEYFGLANAFYELEKPKEAVANFKQAFSENSKNDEALYRLATLSDAYYKDKKIAYQYYKKYLDRFSKKDTISAKFVEKRMQEIKKDLFLKGESLK
ncbi:tetratricopeptide repeat protein [Polaribacter sp.]|nr:tetratricopeptide repeat protein [Polaribacter sp.]